MRSWTKVAKRVSTLRPGCLRCKKTDERRAWKSGLNYRVRYGKLLSSGPGVFTRSAGGDRVVETGQYWLEVSCSQLFVPP